MFLYMCIKENTFTHVFGHIIYMHNIYNARIIVLQAGQEIEKGQEIQEKQRLALSAAHCNVLQHTATYCNTLQHTATHCNTLQRRLRHECDTLRHTATNCNTPLHEFSCEYDTLHHTCSRTLRLAATQCYTLCHCNTLQHAATPAIDCNIRHARKEPSPTKFVKNTRCMFL